MIGNKTIYISHGGTCMMMHNNNDHDLVITEPDYLQRRHEEADTLVAFHANQAYEARQHTGKIDRHGCDSYWACRKISGM